MNKEKPLMLAIEETKENIVKYINEICNENCLSYYYLEIILKDIYNETLMKKNVELQNIKKEYEEKIKELEDKNG